MVDPLNEKFWLGHTQCLEAADRSQQGGEEGDRNGMGRKCPFLHRCKASTRAKRGSAEDFSWIVPFFEKRNHQFLAPSFFFSACLVIT